MNNLPLVGAFQNCLQMFYLPDISADVLEFGAEESKHIARVLRKNIGDTVEITDGMGNLVVAEIIAIDKRNCSAQKKTVTFSENPIPDLTMAVAPTKNIDRFEWFVEKAVEIGVRKIVPILCEHSERKIIKIERIQKIAIAAMKQSKNYYLPEIAEMTPVQEYIAQAPVQSFVAYCPTEGSEYLYPKINAKTPLAIFIGPEGDFSEAEVNLMMNKQIVPVSLGNTRLRTETAAVLSCTLVQTASLV